MTEPKDPVRDDDLARPVAKLLDEIGPESADELDETLRSLGLDPTEIGAKGQQIANAALANSPHNWRLRAPEALADERRRLASKSNLGPINRADTVAAILELAGRFGQAGKHATAHYRNLNEASDQDLADLLAELQDLETTHRPPSSGA